MARKGNFGNRFRAGVFSALILSALVVTATPAQADLTWRGQYFEPVPASSFTVSPGAGRTIGSTVVLWANGAATAFLPTESPTDRLQFTAEAEQCEGSPRIEVAVDDVSLVSRDVDGVGIYGAIGKWSSGVRKVTLRFTNDLLTSQCDRNVKFKDLRFTGPMPNGTVVPVATYQLAKNFYAQITPSTAGSIDTTGSEYWQTPAARLWSPGSMKLRLDSQGARKLFVSVFPTACEGWPSLRITVDGEVVREGPVPASINGAPSDMWVDRTWPNGSHDVELTMYNDRRTALCDRSVRLLDMSFAGWV